MASRRSESNQLLPEFLRDMRTKAGLTQAEVATKLGYTSPQFVSNWERGLANPPVVMLRNLTKLYRVEAEEMLTRFLQDVETDIRNEFYEKRGAKKRRSS
jgi:transcriptional regulator with XRE-family HTH domain